MDTIQGFVVKITTESILMTLVLSAPAIAVSLVIGLAVALFSATTQIQEQTLSFVPKLICVFAVLAATAGWMSFLLMVVKEAFVGFLLGFIAAELFYAVEMAGKIVDMVRGTNQVQLMVPQLGERSSAYGDLNYQLLIVIFLFINGHHVFIAAMF